MLLILLGLLIVAAGISPGPEALAGDPSRSDRVSFQRQVAPILVKKCLGCHSDRKAAGGLSMTTFAALKRGGKTAGETVLEPGDPESSFLVESVGPGASPRMPFKLPPLTGAEIAILTRWVKEGAKFDGLSVSETTLASLVDVLADLPKVVVKAPAGDSVASVAFSPDGRNLAAGIGRQVVVYDVATSKTAATLEDHPGPITWVRFTPDGASLVAAGGRAGQFGSVTVWDVARRQRRWGAKGHADSILAAAVTPDGKALATAGYDRQILIWDLADGKVVRSLKDHSDSVYGLAFARDGKTLASCAADRTVKLWDWTTGKRKATLSEATAELYAVVWTPDGSHLLAAGVDRSIRMWRIAGGEVKLERSAFAHDAAVVRLAVSEDGAMLASSAEDRTVRLWKLDTLSPQATIPPQADWAQALAFHPDGRRLALGLYDGRLALWDPAAGKLALVLREPPALKPAAAPRPVRNAALNPPAPRGAVRGGRVRVTLSGQGVGSATAVVIPEPGMSATIVPAARPDPSRIEIDMAIAADARVGLHPISVITPLGVPESQKFAVASDPELAEQEPNDGLDAINSKPVSLPATLIGTIDRPGDFDRFSFEVKAGQRLVFQVVARSLGSRLLPSLCLLDRQGTTLAQTNAGAIPLDPVLTFTARGDEVLILQIADADYGGSGDYFYRIAAAAGAAVRRPRGVDRASSNIGPPRLKSPARTSKRSTKSWLPMPSTSAAGTILEVPIALSIARQPVAGRSVVVADGPQLVEQKQRRRSRQPRAGRPRRSLGSHRARRGYRLLPFPGRQGRADHRRAFWTAAWLSNRFRGRSARRRGPTDPASRPTPDRPDGNGLPGSRVESPRNSTHTVGSPGRQ